MSWLPSAILDVRNSLSMAFLAISDQYETFFKFCLQNGSRRPFWMSEIHFRSHFWPFQIDTQFFLNFWQDGRRRPFWMSETHFRLHFWPFQIDMQLFFFLKMAAIGHFGCPKFTFNRISGQIQNGIRRPFWMSEIHFLSYFWPFQIDMQLHFFWELFDKMAAVGHFGCPKITFDGISGHFRLIGHFGCLKLTFDSNSGHFRSIQNFFFRRPFWMWENHFPSHFCPFQIDRPFWMSEIHFRWHFWPFQIHTELFFDKMAAGGHFGWDDNVNYRTRTRYLDE